MKFFSQVVVVDFEYEVADGGLPNVLCMVTYVLDECIRHVRTIKLWRGVVGQPLPPLHAYRGEFGKEPPFDIGPDTLFVAYSAWAELTCFMVLSWKFPVHIFDLHTAYLAASNILLPYNPDEERKRQSKKLPDACRAYGIEGWENIEKASMAQDIGEGLWEKYGKERVLEYCEEDIKKSTELLRAQLRDRCDYRGRIRLPTADVERVLWWSNYSAKTVAQIQARGMPWDVPLWNLVQENKPAVINDLLRRFDPSYSEDETIYSPEGEWSYARFERWLARHNVYAWPRLDSGELDISGDAFRLMYHIPGIEALHALRDSLGFIAKARLPIGPDGRNRPSLFPFATATGRNAHAKSPYNAHAAVRSFMLFPPDTIGAYLDWRTQEVGIAAARSGDKNLMRDYAAGDVYHALARLCGLTNDPDPIHWKKTNRPMRDRMKPLQLGINYGMGVRSLSKGLNRHPLIGSTIIRLHKETYRRFWEWREEEVQYAMLARKIESVYGWTLRISSAPNRRTLYNFPMQSGGAEMLRLAAWRMCEVGVVPIMLIHDGILLEETEPEKIELASEIMLQAGRDVCDGFEIGVDTDQYLIGPARYRDKRDMAKNMWKAMMETLQLIGVIPDKDAA